MKQNTQHMEAICNQTALLKSYREHMEKESEKLIQYFGNQLKFNDPLKLMGWRYVEKDREFDQLQKENSSLKMTNLRISEELASFRKSVPDISHQDQTKRSMQSTKKEPLNMETLTKTYTCLGSEDLRDRMQQIQGMKEQARESYDEYKKKFDELLEYLFRTLSQSCSNQQLIKEMKEGPGDSSEKQMVMVPKKRYEQLIQIYSINMAEITVTEMKKKLSMTEQEAVSKEINFIEEQKKQYKQNYSKIIQHPDIDVKDLSLFFKVLTKKFGFEGEWDRYQKGNQKSAQALKFSIDSILGRYQNQEVSSGKIEQQSPSMVKQKFHLKLNALVGKLEFNKKEKIYWEELYSKIREDGLIDFGQIILKIQENNQKHNNKRQQSLIEQLSKFISSSLSSCCDRIQMLLASRLKTPLLEMANQKDLLYYQKLFTDLQSEINSTAKENYWEAVSKVFNQRLEAIFQILQKSLVFLSHNEIYRVLRRK